MKEQPAFSKVSDMGEQEPCGALLLRRRGWLAT